MELDAVAKDIVLANIRNAVPSQRPAKVTALRVLAAGASSVSLAAYLIDTAWSLPTSTQTTAVGPICVRKRD